MKTYFAYFSCFLFSYFCFAGDTDGEDSLTIFLQAGGVHSDIVVPLQHDICNWSAELQQPFPLVGDVSWISFGWGSKLFYLNTPEWSKVKLRHIIGAMVGKGGAAYHIRTLNEPVVSEHCSAFRISICDYKRLCAFLKQMFSGQTSPRRLIAYKPGYTWDGFYEAKGRYWLLNNCNTFSNRALRHAGLSDELWVANYGQLFRALKK
jgi:uncharacterized protein (TIGR02117 family)